MTSAPEQSGALKSSASSRRPPAAVIAAGETTGADSLEAFAADIPNTHTRRAYIRGARDFMGWRERGGVVAVADVKPSHVANYLAEFGRRRSTPTVRQRLAAIRHLFDWLVARKVISVNPASSVRGPPHRVKQAKTRPLSPREARALLDAIDVSEPAGLRDRALIALMVYAFAPIGAALAMKVEDVRARNGRLTVRLRGRGNRRCEAPCHHSLEAYLSAYLDGCGLAAEPAAPLFRTIGRGTDRLTTRRLEQANAYAMVRHRAAAAGIEAKVGNHTLRATGITAYLKSGGTLETAAAMAKHASLRTTQLYDPRRRLVSVGEIERVPI
jgi:site-specific recombinase XerD